MCLKYAINKYQIKHLEEVMKGIATSHQAISAKQRNCNYRPSGAIAQHVLQETQEIDSEQKVVELNGSFWVASKFAHRYYRVVVLDGVWNCSASDERVARMCKAAVEE